MDIEFHYHITYILARKAGFKKKDSFLIAYSSQYVDDNNLHYYINFKDGAYFMNEVSQTMDITKPSFKRQKIYPLFHFVPGDPDSPTARRKDKKKHPFNTTPDNENARHLFDKAISSDNLYRIGIATHAYADSWSHQNFLGLSHEFNAMPMWAIIPNIGHADARHEPDKVDNRWKDARLVEENEVIENNQRLLDAAEQIFSGFWRYLNPGVDAGRGMRKWQTLKEKLKDAMDESYLFGSDERARIKAYRGIINDIPEYDKNKWRYEAVEKRPFETDLFDRYWAKDEFRESRWCKFQEAVQEHRELALTRLKPIYKEAGLQI